MSSCLCISSQCRGGDLSPLSPREALDHLSPLSARGGRCGNSSYVHYCARLKLGGARMASHGGAAPAQPLYGLPTYLPYAAIQSAAISRCSRSIGKLPAQASRQTRTSSSSFLLAFQGIVS